MRRYLDFAPARVLATFAGTVTVAVLIAVVMFSISPTPATVVLVVTALTRRRA